MIARLLSRSSLKLLAVDIELDHFIVEANLRARLGLYVSVGFFLRSFEKDDYKSWAVSAQCQWVGS